MCTAVECLPDMHEALNLIPRMKKCNKTKQNETKNLLGREIRTHYMRPIYFAAETLKARRQKNYIFKVLKVKKRKKYCQIQILNQWKYLLKMKVKNKVPI